MRLANGDFGSRWEDFRDAIADATIPPGVYVTPGPAGNPSFVDADGQYLGYLDLTVPSDSVWPESTAEET